MIEILCIMVGIIICTYLLSKADIKITITHDYKTQKEEQPTVEFPISQEAVDKAEKEANVPTYDEVLAEVHKIIGGDI